jgi:hypothetical protein
MAARMAARSHRTGPVAVLRYLVFVQRARHRFATGSALSLPLGPFFGCLATAVPVLLAAVV